MRTLLTLHIALLLTACTVFPTQHPGVQPEVIMNYSWWNNLIGQPVAWVEFRNTTLTEYQDFKIHVKTYNAHGEVITAFDMYKPFALPGGSTRGFRIALPGKNADAVKVYMIDYDESIDDHVHIELVSDNRGLEAERK